MPSITINPFLFIFLFPLLFYNVFIILYGKVDVNVRDFSCVSIVFACGRTDMTV